MRKDGAYVKKQRLNQVTAYIIGQAGKNRTPVLVSKVLGYCEIEIGLSEKKARDYIQKICDYYGYNLDVTWIKFKVVKDVE